MNSKQLAPHQQRMLAEIGELEDRYNRLYDFTHSDKFEVLCDAEERVRMFRQLNGMLQYKEALQSRIDAF